MYFICSKEKNLQFWTSLFRLRNIIVCNIILHFKNLRKKSHTFVLCWSYCLNTVVVRMSNNTKNESVHACACTLVFLRLYLWSISHFIILLSLVCFYFTFSSESLEIGLLRWLSHDEQLSNDVNKSQFPLSDTVSFRSMPIYSAVSSWHL